MNNGIAEVNFRKYQDSLVVSGGAVIAFGLWAIVKTSLYLMINREKIMETLEQTQELNGDPVMGKIMFFFFSVFIIVVVSAGCLLRTYVGLSARAEGMGRPKGYSYVVISGIMALFYAASLVYEIVNFDFSYTDDSILDTLVAIIVDFTSLLIFVEMVCSAVRVKRIKAAMQRAECR